MQIECAAKSRQRIYHAVIGGKHNVPNLQAGRFCWPIRRDIRNQHTPTALQIQTGSQRRCNGLRACFDFRTMDVAVLLQTLVHELHDPGRNRESQAFASATAGNDESIDPDNVSVHVHQRPTAVARIDGCVGLDVDHGLVGIGLACDGTHHAHSDRALQSFGTSDRQDQLALVDAPARAERQSG